MYRISKGLLWLWLSNTLVDRTIYSSWASLLVGLVGLVGRVVPVPVPGVGAAVVDPGPRPGLAAGGLAGAVVVEEIAQLDDLVHQHCAVEWSGRSQWEAGMGGW